MASIDEYKTGLLKQIQNLLQGSTPANNEDDFNRKLRLRDNLLEFGEEHLSVDAFDRLIWILNDGGVILLPMRSLKKANSSGQGKRKSQDEEDPHMEPPKKKAALAPAPESSTLASDVEKIKEKMKEHFGKMNRRLTDVENRVSVLETRPLADPIAITTESEDGHEGGLRIIPKKGKKSLLPIGLSYENFEMVNEKAQEDREFYVKLVFEFNEAYKEAKLKGYKNFWSSTFNRIFGNQIVKWYHFSEKFKDELPSSEGPRQPVHEKIIVKKVLQDAFPDEYKGKVEDELRKWFSRSQRNYRYWKKNAASKQAGEEIDETYLEDTDTMDDQDSQKGVKVEEFEEYII